MQTGKKLQKAVTGIKHLTLEKNTAVASALIEALIGEPCDSSYKILIPNHSLLGFAQQTERLQYLAWAFFRHSMVELTGDGVSSLSLISAITHVKTHEFLYVKPVNNQPSIKPPEVDATRIIDLLGQHSLPVLYEMYETLNIPIDTKLKDHTVDINLGQLSLLYQFQV